MSLLLGIRENLETQIYHVSVTVKDVPTGDNCCELWLQLYMYVWPMKVDGHN
jgi:hypothetical protein